MQPLRALPVAAVLLLAGCASSPSATNGSGGGAPAAAVAGSGSTRLVATLMGGSVSGSVQLTPGARTGQTRAQVTIRNGPPNAELGWQIRQGQCGERGPELGTQVAYRAITTRGDGSGELTVTLPFSVPTGNAYHVNILRSRTSDALVVCGGLSEAS